MAPTNERQKGNNKRGTSLKSYMRVKNMTKELRTIPPMNVLLMHIKEILNGFSADKSGYKHFDRKVQFPRNRKRVSHPRMPILLTFNMEKLPKNAPVYPQDRDPILHRKEEKLCRLLKMTYETYYTQKCRFFLGLGMIMAAKRQNAAWSDNVGKAQAQLLGNIDATLMSCIWSNWELWGWTCCKATGAHLESFVKDNAESHAEATGCRKAAKIMAIYRAEQAVRQEVRNQEYAVAWDLLMIANGTDKLSPEDVDWFKHWKTKSDEAVELPELVEKEEEARVTYEDFYADTLRYDGPLRSVFQEVGVSTGPDAVYRTKSMFDDEVDKDYVDSCLIQAMNYEKDHPEALQLLTRMLGPKDVQAATSAEQAPSITKEKLLQRLNGQQKSSALSHGVFHVYERPSGTRESLKVRRVWHEPTTSIVGTRPSTSL